MNDKEKSNPFKGNYSLETKEREVLFDKNRGEEWPEGYTEYRKNWEKYPENKFIPEYPLNLDLELSTVCNLKCPMCYTILDEFKENVPVKFMDFDLFKKIIDEIGGKVPAIRLSFRGESTLHPNFVEAIQYAKSKGIKEVSTLTNGSTLTEEYFTKMMKAGIDWITVSVDGMGETYEKIRKPIKFDDIYSKIKMTKEIKKKHGYNRPVIKIQPIWSAIKDNVEEYYNLFAPISDLIMFNPDVDFEEVNRCIAGDYGDIEFVEEFTCPSIYQRLFVCSDGRCIVCCFDMNGNNIVGDANTTSVYDIWHGQKLEQVRKILDKKDGFKEIPICRGCIYPRKIESKGFVNVNGRKVEYYEYIK